LATPTEAGLIAVLKKIEFWRILYNYRNDPRIGETELKNHSGFAELIFSKDRTSAEGEYFNGHGRSTFGTMKLERA